MTSLMEAPSFLQEAEMALAVQEVIQGSKGSKKQAPARTPVEIPDNARAKSYVRCLDFLAEGPIVGLVNGFKSLYLDGVPVQNPDGSYNHKDYTYEATLGTADQDYLGIASAVEREVDDSFSLTNINPYNFTIDNPLVDAVRIKVRTPSLLTQNVSNGDTTGAYAQADCYIKGKNDPGFVYRGSIVMSAKVTSSWEKELLINLPDPGPWQVRIVRPTADSKSTALQNDTTVTSHTEIIYAKLRYPYSALVGSTFDAEQFGSIPERGFLIKGYSEVEVPSNYNPNTRVYTGFWDGTFKKAWTNNPAWCYRTLLLNERFGLGQYVKPEHIDSAALYEIAKYCDESVSDGRGGWEPRFSCNVYIQTEQEAFSLLKSMTSSFRAMVFWSGSSIVASQDRPQPIVRILNNSNVINGEFNYISSKKAVRFTAAYVAYNNPDDQYKLDRVYVEDTDGIKEYGFNPTDLTAWGCTSRSQAMRLGNWTLYSSLYETDLVSFAVSLEGLRFMPGTIISINDELRRGTRDAGRLMGYEDQKFTLDHETEFDSGFAYTISWMSNDGRVIQRKLEAGLNGSLSRVFVGEVTEADLPVDLGVWTLSSTSLSSALYRVVSIKEEEGMTFSVRAIEHHPEKYAQVESNIRIEAAPTVRKANPPKPVGLKLTDELYVSGEAVKTSMNLSVDFQAEAVKYTFMWRRSNGSWNTVSGDQATVTIRDVAVDTYEVICYTTNALKLNSDVVTLTAKVLGKTRPPEDVTEFEADLTPAGVTMKWKGVKDLDLDHYEIRLGSSWQAGEVIGTAKATTYSWIPPTAGTTFVFHIRAKDTSGNYSELVTSLTTDFQRPEDVEAFSAVQSGSKMRWKWAAADRAATYEIRCGETFELGEPLFTTSGTQYEMEWGRLGEKFFWIKGVDYIGNTSVTAYFANLDTQQPSGRNKILYYDVSNLGWPGARYNTEVVGGSLQLVDSANYGEFYYEVQLEKTFRNIVTLDYEVQALAQSSLIWDDMNWTWDSDRAAIPWQVGGDFGTIAVTTSIAYRTALTPNVITSFRLNGDLISEDSLVVPTSSRDIEYAPCRFTLGARINDTSEVYWEKALPATFTTFFTVKVEEASSPTGFVVLGNGTNELRVIYYPTLKKLKAETTWAEAVELSVDLELMVGDILQIGLSQSASGQARNLFAQRLGYPSVFNSAPALVLPAFSDIRLSGHYLH